MANSTTQKTRYRVHGIGIRFQGKTYPINSFIELSETDAKPLKPYLERAAQQPQPAPVPQATDNATKPKPTPKGNK